MNKTVLTLVALLASDAAAAYMPSPTMAKGDRIRVRGESGIEVDATYSPDMTLQMGGALGNDSNRDQFWDHHHRHQDRYRNENSVYIQAVIPITFGERKKPDPQRLYDIELRAREASIAKLEAELELMKAALEAGAVSSKEIFSEEI
ncbi:hypothetical protein JCM19235_2277 [Vibrio maritimus]|uniref:Uncharacterized protein n=1 Tax=Vibrio maritimus TaxID=990268 RepID=A0A090RX87_9VIBR|nr:hypothetical protein JCM19235_2277 [Vibrio maritimus]